ncbi:hypothetical protein ROP_31410 [Rhodococcus opacus B4]|uniref:Uncharacterized protein n=1 Tax=Rhodococcus opacus (strain B4) TaxID=632772 RepID=C1B6T5_RHOOB|nr:hypothetical protein ROP_31410 [Rhodococcus opacus B4]
MEPQGAYLRKGWMGGSTKKNPRHIAAPDLLDRDYRRDRTEPYVGGGVGLRAMSKTMCSAPSGSARAADRRGEAPCCDSVV